MSSLQLALRDKLARQDTYTQDRQRSDRTETGQTGQYQPVCETRLNTDRYVQETWTLTVCRYLRESSHLSYRRVNVMAFLGCGLTL